MKIVINEENIGGRIDKFLALMLDKSRTYISKMFDNDLVKVNEKIIKPSYLLELNDEIEYELLEDETLDLKPIDLKLDIIYEDEDVAVVYKPEGLTVHPGANKKEETLVHGLMHQLDSLSSINGVVRPGIVHRIDKDTSGILMIAKNNEAHEDLQLQLKNHTTKRVYHAIVYGELEADKGKITAPIGRDLKDRIKMAVVKDGKHAVTNFRVLKRLKGYTYIECILETGRTHQIRVHLSYINHPLVGDNVYGPKKKHKDEHGQYLHAKSIGFIHPKTKEYMEFDSDIPNYFKEFIEANKK